MSGHPPVFKPFAPGQKNISAGQMNYLQKAVAESMRLSFDSRHFVRQGTTVSLKPSKPVAVIPFEMTRKGLLDLGIAAGIVWHWNGTDERVAMTEVAEGTLEMAASATNYIYLRATLTPYVVATTHIAWGASLFEFVTDVAEISDTVDFADAVSGAGDYHVLLGEVVTDGTEIESDGITQDVKDHIPMDLSWTLNLINFTCAVA